MRNDSVWMDAAYKLVREHGYTKAKQLCTQWRNHSSPGTASFAFHNATLKALRQLATVGPVDSGPSMGDLAAAESLDPYWGDA